MVFNVLLYNFTGRFCSFRISVLADLHVDAHFYHHNHSWTENCFESKMVLYIQAKSLAYLDATKCIGIDPIIAFQLSILNYSTRCSKAA